MVATYHISQEVFDMKSASTILAFFLLVLFSVTSSSFADPQAHSHRSGLDSGTSVPGNMPGTIVPDSARRGLNSERERHPSRSSSSSTQTKKRTFITTITTPKLLKKKSRIKVHGHFLRTGRVRCTTMPKLSLKEVLRNEKQIHYQVESNVADTRYIVKCSGNGSSREIAAQGYKKPIAPQNTRGGIIGSGQVDLVSTLALRGKIETRAGNSQSLKLIIANNTKPAKSGNIAQSQQPYQAKIFLAAVNFCKDTLTIQHPLSKPFAQKNISLTTIPSGGKRLIKNLSIPLSTKLATGNYYWHVMIDSTGRIQESREDNNLFCLTQAVKIIGSGPSAITTCDGFVPTIRGDNGNNIIKGTSGPDIIHGLGGNDIIYGLDGNDIICGGDGYDRIHGGLGDDHLFGNSNISKGHLANCYSKWHAETANHDRLLGGSGNDILDGGPGYDCVFGEDGNDTIIGAEGTDYLIGGKGDDLYRFTNRVRGFAKIIEKPNSGTDTLDFSDFPDRTGIPVDLQKLGVDQTVGQNPELIIHLSPGTAVENVIGSH